MDERVNIITMKWGTAYGSEYVNRLYASVAAHLSRPFNFICLTDDPTDVREEVQCFDLPEFTAPTKYLFSTWRKLSLLRNDVPFDGLCLFLDLDLLIMQSLDCFFEYGSEDELAIIHNWIEPRKTILRPRPDIGNTSCFRFQAKQFHYVYEQYLRDPQRIIDRFPTEQATLTHYAGPHRIYWPDEWVSSFKRHCTPPFPLNLILTPRPPKNTRILAFHGRPNPDQAIRGYRGKKMHHHARPAHWITKYWNENLQMPTVD